MLSQGKFLTEHRVNTIPYIVTNISTVFLQFDLPVKWNFVFFSKIVIALQFRNWNESKQLKRIQSLTSVRFGKQKV